MLTSSAPETAACTSAPVAMGPGRETSARHAAQKLNAVVISHPMGLTVPARKNVMGVSATTVPQVPNRFAEAVPSRYAPQPSITAETRADTMRIAYRAASPSRTTDGQPTSA